MALKHLGSVCLLLLAICSVAKSACTTDDVRLEAGPTKRQGRVEICINNQWGTVCHKNWGTKDARVVCNQLNYDASGAIARSGGYFAKGWGKPIWLNRVRCKSGEYKLIDCPRNCIGCNSGCNHNKDAGAECPACLDGNIWLPGGTTWREGTVEVCYNGVWSTVCDNQFGQEEAKVVCAQMGYDTEGAQFFSTAYFGERYGPIILDNLTCTGSESNLLGCSGNAIGDNVCTHSQDAGVRCPVCTQGNIRLWSAKNDTPAGEGMLHYCHDSGDWEAVCRYQWSCVDAKVACRDLGFNGSLTVAALYNVDDIYGFWLPVLPQRVQCVGNEANLKSCNFVPTTWCDHALYETAGAKCIEDIVGHGCTNGDIRLVNGKTTAEGRVEYCFHDEWSPFCVMHDEEASVACKQLGYTEYTIASLFKDERYGVAGYVSDFRSITCSDTASENHMSECDIDYSYGCTINSCGTEYGIKCFKPGECEDGDARLVNGNIEQEGRVEVCYKGVWSTICDWGWNALDAHIMCRTLGYDSSISPDLLLDSYFGDGEYPVAMSNIKCGGWEKNILDCPRQEYLSFYPCPRHNLASVRCYDDCTEGEVRLVGGAYENEGTVEICAGGLWGLIADAGWDDNDAKVICRQAGFTNDNAAVSKLGSFYGRSNKTVHYTNVHCQGGEDTIDFCTKQVVPLSDGRLIYLNATVVGVDCIYEAPTHPPCIEVNITALESDGCTEGNVRLVGGDGDEGRVDYCLDGRWSPFCIMDEITASVVCKSLGFTEYSWASISYNTSYGIMKNYSHFDNISCSDTSVSDISQCTVNDGDCIPYCPNKNIALRCFTPGECSNEGEVRLVNGFVDNEGRVEVCVNGVWGGICDDGWDGTDAHVICQQLGHPKLLPVAYHNSYFGDGVYPLVYSMMGCEGFEDTIGDCNKQTYSQFSCSRDRFAGVLCGQDCQNGDLRLQGGPSASEGAVEVCIDYVWGNILDAGFNDDDASLVCQQLGFFADGAESRPGSLYGKTGATVHLSDVICYGDEASILDCSLTIWSLSEGKYLLADSANQVAGVYCITETTCIAPPPADTACQPGSILLDNPLSTSEGNLLFCANGTWSPFCSLNGGTASVACKALGFDEYTWAGIVDDGRYNPTMNMSLFQNFTCSGEEASISDCPANKDCISRCTTPYGIQCYSPESECKQEDVRLANGDIAQEGRVEVCIDNVWGAVCGVEWNKIDALVVCRQLGFGIGEPWIYTDASNFGETPGPIIYSNVGCQGWEGSIEDCYKATYYDVSCPRSSMAGVVCRDDCQDGAIKLYGGSTDNEGTVVVCYDNFWGIIGQTTWDDRDAKVVCRNLGYPTDGAYARLNSYYGKPNITLLTSSVVCEGDELTLTDCKISWLEYASGKAAVQHVEAGGVYCPPPVPPPECETPPPFVSECTNGETRVQTVDPSTTKGLLQYCYNNQWTYFCSLNATEATVACYQLGYKEYSWATIITDGSLGTGNKYTAIDSIKCLGFEKTLTDCQITSQDDCYPKCASNVAIQCYSPVGCNEGEVRLADGGFSQRGRVEHCYNGVWGTICDSGWDNTDVYSLCRGLGYDGTESTSITGSGFGAGTGPAIYSNFACDGTKTDILKCDKNIYPNVKCSPDNLAGALCTSMCTEGDIRLVGGENQYEGTVEICYNGLWGMISDFNWGSSDARVACQQLKLPTDDFSAIVGSHFGRPDDAVHLSNIGCFGDELTLGACDATRIDISDAQVYQTVAGVTCRAKSFNTTTTSATATATTTATATPSNQASSSDSKTAVTNVVIILGVVVLIAIVAAVVIIVGMIFMRKRRDEKTRKMTMPDRHVTQPPVSELEKDVINPLAVEAGLDEDDDENTKTLQDLIQESQMK